MSNDIVTLRRELIGKGWCMEKTNGGHVRMRTPTGESIITSSSPSDFRVLKKIKAQIKRYEKTGVVR